MTANSAVNMIEIGANIIEVVAVNSIVAFIIPRLNAASAEDNAMIVVDNAITGSVTAQIALAVANEKKAPARLVTGETRAVTPPAIVAEAPAITPAEVAVVAAAAPAEAATVALLVVKTAFAALNAPAEPAVAVLLAATSPFEATTVAFVAVV